MALGTNPKFSQVKAFFSGPNNLSAYVRGGSYVPNIAANAAISTTVAGLKLSQFSGADNPPPYTPITSVTFTGNATFGWNQTSTITASSNGSSASKTFSWTKVTGQANLTIASGANTPTVTIDDTSTNGSFSSHIATFRCTVSDGTSSAYGDFQIESIGNL